MSEEKTDWKYVDSVIAGDKNIENKQLSPKTMADSISLNQEDMQPEGIIAKYKANSISKKASLQLMQHWYKSQLEVTKHQLESAVKVKVKETDAEVERLLADISKRHLKYLMELEFVNMQEKQEALDKLGNQSSDMLNRLQSRDWPDAIKEKMVNGVIDLHERFFEKLMQE